jgi:hypothetical protein
MSCAHILKVSDEPDYSCLKLEKIAKINKCHELTFNGKKIYFQISDLCCTETLLSDDKILGIFLADISNKSNLKYLNKILTHIDELTHKKIKYNSLNVRCNDLLYDEIVCLNNMDNDIEIFKNKNTSYKLDFVNKMSFREIHSSNILYKKNCKVLLNPMISIIGEEHYKIVWRIQQIQMERSNYKNNFLITRGLKDSTDTYKIKNEEYYLAMDQYCPIILDILSNSLTIEVVCHIFAYLSVLNNDIFINCDKYFGCYKAYMWACRSFVFTPDHMYRISKKSVVIEQLEHPQMKITSNMQIINKLKEIKKTNHKGTFYPSDASIRNVASSMFDYDEDSGDEINSHTIMDDILHIYLQQLKLLFLNDDLLQKNYFNLIRFIINHLCDNLSEKKKEIVLSYYDKKINSLTISNSDKLIKKIILTYFV